MPAPTEDAPSSGDDHPLIRAVEDSDLQKVESLLSNGEKPSVTNTKGETPLHRAAELGAINILAVLLLHGADVTALDKVANTAWDYASDHKTEALLVLFGSKAEEGCFSLTREAGDAALETLNKDIRQRVCLQLGRHSQASAHSAAPAAASRASRWQEFSQQKEHTMAQSSRGSEEAGLVRGPGADGAVQPSPGAHQAAHGDSPHSSTRGTAKVRPEASAEAAPEAATATQPLEERWLQQAEEHMPTQAAHEAATATQPLAARWLQQAEELSPQKAQAAKERETHAKQAEELEAEDESSCDSALEGGDSSQEEELEQTAVGSWKGRRRSWKVADYTFSADFDSGNCSGVMESSSCPAGEHCFDVWATADPKPLEGNTQQKDECQWFYFRMSGTFSSGQLLKFQVLNLKVLNNRMEKVQKCTIGLRPVVNSAPLGKRPSLDSWRFVESVADVASVGDGYALTFQHRVTEAEAKEQDLYFAYTFPFPLFAVREHLKGFVQDLQVAGDYVHREILTNSLGGRPIELVTFTGMGSQPRDRLPPLLDLRQKRPRPRLFEKRQAVFISARVHPAETPASYMLQGLLDFLISSSDIAEQLMRRYVFFIVPVLNPDGVKLGHQRMDTLGENLNRVYGQATLERHPSIFAAQRACECAHQHQNGLRLYLDLHAHSTFRGVFLFGDAQDSEKEVQARLFGYALSRRCPIFEYSQSNFQEQCGGTGKSWATAMTSMPLCFTVESHYSRGHHSSATFRPDDWRSVGVACLQALWDLDCMDQPEPARWPMPSNVPGRVRDLERARSWLTKYFDATLVRDRPAPLGVSPSRALPKFFRVQALNLNGETTSTAKNHPELVGRCVEVVECIEATDGSSERRCRLHEDDGGFLVPASDLTEKDSQVKDTRYKVLRATVISKDSQMTSEELKELGELQPGLMIDVGERYVTHNRLRLRLATGGWVSEYCINAFDERLGGDPLVMRLPEVSSPMGVMHAESPGRHEPTPPAQTPPDHPGEQANPVAEKKKVLSTFARRLQEHRNQLVQQTPQEQQQPAEFPVGVVSGASRSSSSSSSCPTQADTAASSSQAWREACPPAARELQRAGLCNRGSFRKQLDGSAVQMPRGAIRQTLTRAASGLGLLPAGAHGPTPLPKPPMSLQREGEWELVFRQRNTAFTPVDITPRNTEDADADVFSRLDELERYRGVNARLIFKMVFPRCKEPNCNMWAQRTNPIRSFEIDGFERIKFAFDRDDKSDHAFNGLQLSRSDDILLHTYNPANPGACWYVIGSREPRFAGANGNKAESCVELYVLRPP